MRGPEDPGDGPHPSKPCERIEAHLRARRAAVEPIDEIWLVTDVDRHDLARLHEARQRLEDRRWHLAVSNPCFEVWLQLHLVDAVEGDEAKAIKAAWGAMKHQRAPREAWPFGRTDVEQAIVRASATDDGSHVPSAPASRVHALVSEVLG